MRMFKAKKDPKVGLQEQLQKLEKAISQNHEKSDFYLSTATQDKARNQREAALVSLKLYQQTLNYSKTLQQYRYKLRTMYDNLEKIEIAHDVVQVLNLTAKSLHLPSIEHIDNLLANIQEKEEEMNQISDLFSLPEEDEKNENEESESRYLEMFEKLVVPDHEIEAKIIRKKSQKEFLYNESKK